MRITVCELPHEPRALASAWVRLCQHTREQNSELVLLPEFAFVEPLWEAERFDPVRWDAALVRSDARLQRLTELNTPYVVGTRPVTIRGRRLNQGFLWSSSDGMAPLRSKFFLPEEPGNWEARWFDRGDPAFPLYQAGALSFGLNICTEMWALETYAAYPEQGVQVIMSPRATAAATTAKWLSVGEVGAVRAGAFSVSSNRVDPMGVCGGAGWIISPDGQILAITTHDAPFATIDIDLAATASARAAYPRYVFER
ncbi:MAG: carbon-nitrogen hydrolase family protein [Gemmatimonadota bacterium]